MYRPLDPAETVPWGKNSVVPSWCVDKEASKQKIDVERLTLRRYVGPAVLWLWRAFKATWLLWMASPLVSFFAICFGSRRGAGLPEVQPWLVPALLVSLLPLLYLEHRVRAILMVPMARSLAAEVPMRVLGFPVDFTKWLAFNSVMSFSGHVDVVLNGLFVTRTILSYLFDSPMAHVWAVVLSKSLFAAIFSVPFWSLALLAFLLMGLQALYAITYALPRTDLDIQGNRIEYGYGENPCYASWQSPNRTHLESVPVLLDVTRMASVIMPWFQACFVELQSSSFYRFCAPNMLAKQLRLTIAKFAFFSVLESALFANIQVSVLGLDKALDPQAGTDLATMASISVGFLVGIYTLSKEYTKASQLKDGILQIDIEAEYCTYLRGMGNSVERINTRLAAFRRENLMHDAAWEAFLQECPWVFEQQPHLIGDQADLMEGQQAQQAVQRTFRCFQAVCVVYIMLLGRAVVQLRGVILCPTGLYNIGAGCVEASVIRPFLTASKTSAWAPG